MVMALMFFCFFIISATISSSMTIYMTETCQDVAFGLILITVVVMVGISMNLTLVIMELYSF